MLVVQGWVDRIEGGGAYVTIDFQGTRLHGEFPACPELKEHRRFLLALKGIPDAEVTPEREEQIRKEVEQALEKLKDLPF